MSKGYAGFCSVFLKRVFVETFVRTGTDSFDASRDLRPCIPIQACVTG
jgi:hypothetical protein